jgi:hypothetical protein
VSVRQVSDTYRFAGLLNTRLGQVDLGEDLGGRALARHNGGGLAGVRGSGERNAGLVQAANGMNNGRGPEGKHGPLRWSIVDDDDDEEGVKLGTLTSVLRRGSPGFARGLAARGDLRRFRREHRGRMGAGDRLGRSGDGEHEEDDHEQALDGGMVES